MTCDMEARNIYRIKYYLNMYQPQQKIPLFTELVFLGSTFQRSACLRPEYILFFQWLCLI